MRSRLVIRLAAKLRCTHRKSNSWRVTAEAHHIYTPEGQPNPGLAKRIAHNRYKPSPDLFKRLVRDGAIRLPRPRPLQISNRDRLSIILALKERKPLPPPSPRTVRQFDEWLTRRKLTLP